MTQKVIQFLSKKGAMETFGEWLREQRTARNLTREEFSKRVGCSVSALRKIEYGERRPSIQIAELMANCLNVPPEERLTFVRVARGELSVERLVPESKRIIPVRVPPQKNNLPVFPTPLIGREHEVEKLSQLLRDPQCRMLTLVGPGGIGKTRLAIETASNVQDLFAAGVYFVPLASANSTRFILPVLADSVGLAFHHESHADPKKQLFEYLKDRHALLLIDNLEHLLAEPGVEMLVELLSQAQQLKLLITSHKSLEFQGEWVFEVQGLPLPESTYSEGTEKNTSVELFLQRAQRVNVGYSFSTQDYPSILRICQLVDGMPLGIELAAAWVRTLSCGEIVSEIERGLDFLSLSARDIPARHRSMRAVFDHSWKLLTEQEQRILQRLSVFRGGFQREAAEQVAEATLNVLSTLIMKSLIRRSYGRHYDLHELIRQFAAEELARRPEEQSETQMCHGRYYLTHFGQQDEPLRSSAQRETLAELTAEMDNFRTAWTWAVAHGEFELIEHTLRTFIRLYDTRGWYQDGLYMLDQALETLEKVEGVSPKRANQLVLGHLLAIHSWLAYRVADYEQAQRMLEHSLEILRPLNEPRALVEAITYLGRVMEMTGNYARAQELYVEGLEIATTIGDWWFEAICLTLHTALVGLTLGTLTPELTHHRLQSAVADWRKIGDPRLIALALDFLSRSALRLGRYDEARAALEENVALNSSIGFGWGLGTAYRALGRVAQMQGEHEQAVEMFHKSLDLFTELGGSWFAARVLAEMGVSILALGNDTEAGRVWRKSLRIAIEINGTPVALDALVGLANLQAKEGDKEYALELLLFILHHPASLQVTKNRAIALQAELEAKFSPTEIEMIQAHAREQTLEDVAKYILA
jgi:predicted ATPase/transcriptional regulator with XRE-family HTH domain